MRDVTHHAFAVLRTIAERQEMPLAVLCANVIDPAEAAREGMHWDQFCTLTERIEVACGSAEKFQSEGACTMRMPELGPALSIMRTVAGTRGLYWANFRWGGPSLFRVVTTTFEVRADGLYSGTIRIPDNHRPCDAFHHLCAGVFQALPRGLGLPDADVAVHIEGRVGTYVVTPPPSLTVWARIAWSWRAIFSSREVVNELAQQNELLTIESREANRARKEADAQRALAEESARIAEERRAEAELAHGIAEAARVEAVDALRVKSEFINTMSHELRTPLNGILGMTQLLLGSPLGRADRDNAETILSSGNLLLRLINDLLDFAKMDAGQLVLDATPTDLRSLVEDVLHAAAPGAMAHNLDLFGIVAPDVPATVAIDSLRLRQVLNNLVDNAVKFTSAGEVVVRVGVESASPFRLTISVTDTGIGISSEQRTRIFLPFMQADNSTTRLYGGTGLGLSICARIVGAFGGIIELESEPEQGSCFHFAIPVERVGGATLVATTGRSAQVLGPASVREALTALLQLEGWGVVATGGDAIFVDTDHASMPEGRALPVFRVARTPLVGQPALRKPLRRTEVRAALQACADGAATPVRRKVLVLDDDPIHKRIVSRAVARLGHDLANDDVPDVVILTLPGSANVDEAVGDVRRRYGAARLVAVGGDNVGWGENAPPDARVARPLDVVELGRALAG